MLHEKLIEKIEFEIAEIETELESFKVLIDSCKVKEPDLIEKTAAAGVLHSFYSGIENILVVIAKNYDKNLPVDKNWHNKLLNQASAKTYKREPVLSKDNATALLDYLGFRHFYRHSYSFYIDWNLLNKLIGQINEVWEAIKKDLLVFLDFLKMEA